MLIVFFGITALVAVTALLAVVSRKGRTEDRARAYLAGVTYVLSDDPDAAIAELSRAAQLSRQTLETYFALGTLFRRKGDLERAIRLHQNILLRPGLSAEVRRRAELALALDYRRSGLREKASECYGRVLGASPDSAEALLRYRQLLEEAGEWGGAVQLQQRLGELGPAEPTVLAHLLANLARALEGTPDEAEKAARSAVEADPTCADAHLALAQVLASAHRKAEAATAFERALGLQPELFPRVLPVLKTVLGAAELERLLTTASQAGGSGGAPAALAHAQWRRGQGDVDGALALLRRLVEERPWSWEARRELEAMLLAHDRSAEVRVDYQQMLGRLGDATLGFLCRSCQHRLPELRFRCPVCEAWDTVAREEPGPRSVGSPADGGPHRALRPVI
jgi:lipopolysaccharide assembly protein B